MKLKLKDIVWNVLKDIPEARESDKVLILEVWRKQGFELNEEQKEIFQELATPETITRLRREIQAFGFWKASNFKQTQRSLKEMEYREKYRQSSF